MRIMSEKYNNLLKLSSRKSIHFVNQPKAQFLENNKLKNLSKIKYILSALYYQKDSHRDVGSPPCENDTFKVSHFKTIKFNAYLTVNLKKTTENTIESIEKQIDTDRHTTVMTISHVLFNR